MRRGASSKPGDTVSRSSRRWGLFASLVVLASSLAAGCGLLFPITVAENGAHDDGGDATISDGAAVTSDAPVTDAGPDADSSAPVTYHDMSNPSYWSEFSLFQAFPALQGQT